MPNLLENLPEEIQNKINKTAQTRGAQPYSRVPYQNRVARWSRAVVPFRFREVIPPGGYQNAFTIMVRPDEYFDPTTKRKMHDFPRDVIIGQNAFIYYSTRHEWGGYPPLKEWQECSYVDENGKPLDSRRTEGKDVGHYIARVPATTATEGGEEIVKGLPQGIRFFEYASELESWKAKGQLAFLAWNTAGIRDFASGPMPDNLMAVLQHENLADVGRLIGLKVMNTKDVACCPLCRKPIEARELIEKMEQVEGREVSDLTVTEANLFHLFDLRPGLFNHGIYKLGWGHHHCNTVARDMGLEPTLKWMREVVDSAERYRV